MLDDEQVRLTRLVAKAKEGPGGAFVSAVAYETDLATTRGLLKEARREQQKKDCTVEKPVRLPTIQ
jgi:hypothetical protein